MRTTRGLPLLLSIGLLGLGLAACGDDDDSGDSATSADAPSEAPAPAAPGSAAEVCNGETLDGAPAYERGSAQVAVFTDSGDGYEFSSYTTDLPEGTTALIPEEASVIVCMEVTDSEVVETCEFEDDDSGERFTQEKADATYDVRGLVAASGEELFGTELSAKAGDCGFIASFTEGEDTRVDYAKPGDALAKELRPITGG